jgi:Domain of unknown function (DUF1918)
MTTTGSRLGADSGTTLRSADIDLSTIQEMSRAGYARVVVADGQELFMQAQVGDELTVKGLHQGDEDRHGEIIEVIGADGAPPYMVH